MRNYDIIMRILKKNNDCKYINDIYTIIIELTSKKNQQHRKYNSFIINLCFYTSLVISALLIALNIFFECKLDFNKKIAIARVPRTKNKISKVHKEIQFVEDDIKNRDFTIFRIGSRLDRLTFLVNSYIKLSIIDYRRIKYILTNKQLTPFASKVFLKCVKRIPHTVVYGQAIEHIMINYKLPIIYTGQMYDRFALVEEELSKKYNKKLICIPHGIETTEEMPVGYIGDVFYCSSPEMARKLNNLYGTSKFIFDNDITRKMYRIKEKCREVKCKKKIRVVFFTQPIYIELTEKIILSIARHLELKQMKLYIKVHPNEDPSDYSVENTEMINDFEEAIIENLCISLSSTVLLEAIYNDSISISIIHLINNTMKLTGRFEFLKDRRILKPKDEIDILEMIDKFI